MKMTWCLVLAMVLPGFINEAFGQTNEQPPEQLAPLTTDRPSFTTDSNMMDAGRFQLELGYTYTDLKHGDASTFPEALVRYGLNEKWELRLGWGGYAFGTEDGNIAGDTDFGFKWKFHDAGDEFICSGLQNVDMALITTFTLPTGHGHNDFDFGYEFLIGWNYQLDDRSGLAGNFGFGAPTDLDTGDRFAKGIASLMYSRTYGEATSVFGEFYTNFPAADGQDAEYVVQTGVLHRLSDDMQIDFRVGAGLNDQAPDWLIGFGFVYRF